MWWAYSLFHHSVLKYVIKVHFKIWCSISKRILFFRNWSLEWSDNFLGLLCQWLSLRGVGSCLPLPSSPPDLCKAGYWAGQLQLQLVSNWGRWRHMACAGQHKGTPTPARVGLRRCQHYGWYQAQCFNWHVDCWWPNWLIWDSCQWFSCLLLLSARLCL